MAEEPIPQPRSGQVLVRRMYAGVNASDVNFTAGRYFGSPEKSAERLPFDAGFEAVGVVAGVGPGVKGRNAKRPTCSVASGDVAGVVRASTRVCKRSPL